MTAAAFPFGPKSRRILFAARQGPDLVSFVPDDTRELRRINLAALVAMRLRARGMEADQADDLALEAATVAVEFLP